MTRRRLTRAQRVRIFDATGGRCHICNLKIQAGERWEADHVIPHGLTGKNDLEAFRPAHVHCHKDKTRDDNRLVKKAIRQRAKHLGIKRTGRGFRGWRKFDGTVVNARER